MLAVKVEGFDHAIARLSTTDFLVQKQHHHELASYAADLDRNRRRTMGQRGSVPVVVFRKLGPCFRFVLETLLITHA